MNTALILAGGLDPRFHMDIPKQFVNVNNKPVIIYTLEIFQNHPDIDEIIVTCLDGWQEMVRVYGKQFNITKLKEIIPGERRAGVYLSRVAALKRPHGSGRYCRGT